MQKLQISFLFLFLLVVNLSFGQIQLLDEYTKEPIPFAHIISPGGMLISTSNIEGIFAANDLSKLEKCDGGDFIIQHISYQNKSVSFDTLKCAKTICLQIRDNALAEVVITNKEPDYIVLKGYFRSYQLDNNMPKYYTDGIVEYYIPFKKKNDLKFRLEQCRSYRNEKMIEAEKKRMTTISMVVAGIPYIEPKALLQDLDQKCVIYDTDKERVIKIDTSIVGGIKMNKSQNSTQVFIDLVAPRAEITHSLFNYTSRITKQLMTENYQGSNDSIISKSDLVSRIEFRKFFFKHKKEEEWTQIDVFIEFYVFESSLISKSQMKDIKTDNFFGMAKTSYTYEFWKDASLIHLPKLNKNIEDLLGDELKTYE